MHTKFSGFTEEDFENDIMILCVKIALTCFSLFEGIPHQTGLFWHCKTPLISMYGISYEIGTYIFGARKYLGGGGWLSGVKNPERKPIQCLPKKCCGAYISVTMHILSGYKGKYIGGGGVLFGALQPAAYFMREWGGT